VADGIVVIDERGRIEAFNRSAGEMFGYGPEEVVGRNVSMLMPEPHHSRHDGYLGRYLDTGIKHIIGQGLDVEGVRKDGKTFPLWLRVSELRSADGGRRFVGSLRDVTERKTLEDKLRLSEARYRHAQQTASLGHWTWFPGPDGKSTGGWSEYSEAAAAIFAVTPAELAVSNTEFITRFVHPDDRAYAARLFAEVNERRTQNYSGRYRIVRPNGEVRTVRVVGEHMVDGQGRIRYALGVVQDVTEQIRAEEALRVSEGQHRRAHQIARLGHWERRPGDGESWGSAVARFSESLSGILGIARGELTIPDADFIERFVVPEDRAAVLRAYATAGDPGAHSYSVEYRLRRPDGSTIAVHEIADIERDTDGRIRSTAGTIQDITSHKQALMALLAAREEAARLEQRLADAIENLDDAFSLYDSADRLVMFNRRYLEFYSVAADVLRIGATYEETLRAYVARARPAEAAGREEDWIAERLAAHRGGDIRFEFQTADGRWLLIREHKTGEGGIVSIRTDITDRKQVEETLLQAKEHAEATNRIKSDFLAGMSHELRTPLNAVIGFADAILHGIAGQVTDKQREYLTDIGSAGRHLLDVINDVLDLSKIEAGHLEIHDSVVEPRALLERCMSLVRHQADGKRLRLTMEMPPDLPTLRADELALKKALINLLSNAVKYTPEGGKVTLSSRLAEDGGLIFVVADTGIGMRAQDIPIVLLPFRRLGDTYTRRQEGTGLGLPLAKSLIELHGGSLDISSSPGAGTTVSIRLPRERVIGPAA